MDHLTSINIAAWLACLLFVAGLAKTVLSLTDRLRDKPSAGEVAERSAEKFTPRETADELRARITAIEALRNTDQEAASFSRKNIYDEMRNMEKRIDAALIGIRAEMGDLERRLNASDESRTLKLHDRLNEILTDLGEMRGEVHAKKT
jgi:hypothetical protein